MLKNLQHLSSSEQPLRLHIATSLICFQFRLQDARSKPFHAHVGTKAFPSFSLSEATYDPVRPLHWLITRARDEPANAIVISPKPTQLVLTSKRPNKQYGNPVEVLAEDVEPTKEFSAPFDDLFSPVLDYSDLESLRFR